MPAIKIAISSLIKRIISAPLLPLGTIFTNNGTSLTGFTNLSGNFSTNGVRITAAKSGGTLFSSRLSYTSASYSSNLETWSQTVIFDVASKSGFGLGIGTDGGNPMCGTMLLTALPGKARIYNSSNQNVLATSADTMSINNNDIIVCVHSIVMNTHTFTYTNQRTSQVVSVSYTYPLNYPSTERQPVNYQPCLYALGGTQYVTSWTYGSDALVGANYLFVGDSITARLFAASESTRWAFLAAGTKSFNILASPGNKTSDFITTGALNEITSLNAKKVVICLGTNDVLQSVNVAVSMANLTTLKNTIQALGGTVIFCKIPPLDSTSVVTFNTNLVTTFGSLVKPDLYTELKGAGTQYAVGKSPDGIHPADTVQQDIADEVSQYL